jgi:DNA (cytosine-5)-methyltransferase 1
MSRPKLLDLFCCEGGASMGYHRAGFDVYGIDLFRHRGPDGKLRGYRRQRYPFPAVQGDALDLLQRLTEGERLAFDDGDSKLGLDDFAVIAASPPCQAYSITKNAHKTQHPDLLGPTRNLLKETGLPYVIENVPGAPMDHPLMLCGTHFGLRAIDSDGLEVWLRRHRLFESNILLMSAGDCRHPQHIMCAGVYGNGSPSRDAAKARAGGYTPPSQQVRADLMEIDWMSRNGLSQSIPPAYTQFIGEQLLERIEDV